MAPPAKLSATRIPTARILDVLPGLLEPFAGIRLAVLFGSVARGAATARSDVDLGILLAEDEPIGTLWEIECEVASRLRRTVDLVDLRRAPPLLRLEVARGVAMVEREEGTWSHFQARAMIDWWDWAPTARHMAEITALKLREEIADGQS